jgi:hypothetical protein
LSTKTWPGRLALTLALLLAGGVFAAMDTDVLRYYWTRANATFKSRDPMHTGASFSFVARTFQKKIGQLGEITSVDSASVQYFYSFGNLDSTKTIQGDPKKLRRVDLIFPNIFDSTYRINDFPNDIGDSLLAIGFDTDSSADSLPVGLALIDRRTYSPKWAYLYYPDSSGFRRFTRSFRLAEQAGLVFPDSVWIVAIKDEFLFSTTYRLETGIRQFMVYR